MVTQKELKEILKYDYSTGLFFWNVARQNIRAGCKAGNLEPSGYVRISVLGKKYYAHRLAWLYVHGNLPRYEIDHIDGVKNNNRILNLRDVSHKTNNKNKKMPRSNKSGCVGVLWNQRRDKWIAQIKSNQEVTYLGLYTDWFEAVCARKSAENVLGFHKNHGRIQ